MFCFVLFCEKMGREENEGGGGEEETALNAVC